MPGTRKLGRDTAHRLAMLRGLVTFFFENGKIETTATRAQEVRALAEKMITIAKEDTLANRRNVMAFITKESVTNKLSRKSLRSMLTVTAATPASQSSGRAAATQLRWRSLS